MLRFAPSPTGDMHIGNLRVAILNYLVAKQTKQKFIIRIEDTDLARNIDGKDKEILRTLTLFGLLWDELFYQSHNIGHHNKIAQYLLEKNKAFLCYCTKEFLEQKKQEAIDKKEPFRYKDEWANIHKDSNPKPAIRLKGASGEIEFTDKIKGNVCFSKEQIDSFVIIRDDGNPTYNFACSVDDMLYDISLVIRGEDHTSNTPKQILIRENLDYEKTIQYAHIPIILNQDGKKMSKRDDASSVSWLLEQGFLPQAISNYLILLGNKTPKEVFTLAEAIEWFNIENLSKSPARFDIDKLRFLNREHFKLIPNQDLAILLDHKDQSIGALAKLYLQEASTLNELREKIASIFASKKDKYDIWESQCKIIIDSIEKIEIPQEYQEFKDLLIKSSGLNGKDLFKPLRILLTGSQNGVELSDLYPHLKHHIKEIIRREK